MMTTKKELFGHPIGLYVLFFTEMWERFSYYGMRAIFVLYLVAETTSKNAGLGFEKGDALALYGWYTMLVYVASIPGGWLADRFLGQRKAVLLGGILLVFGHTILAFEGLVFFYIGLLLIVSGVGMLKPNIAAMVGNLYAKGDIRREKGFTIFYIGINIGAFLSALVVGFVAEICGWHYGFGLAGLGMLLGLLQYTIGTKYLKNIGNQPKNFLKHTSSSEFKNTQGLSIIEKDRIKVLLLSFLLVIVFWGAFEQAGGLMNLYAKEKTSRVLMGWEIPATWFQSLNPLFIVLLGSFITAFWVKRKRKKRLSTGLFQMIVGLMIMGMGFSFMSFASFEFENTGSSAMYWLVFAYLFHTVGELCISPVALSFVSKLAPLRYVSLMMGIYYAVTGLGNKLAGILGEFSESFGEFSIFTGIFIFCLFFGMVMLLLRKKIEPLTHGADN